MSHTVAFALYVVLYEKADALRQIGSMLLMKSSVALLLLSPSIRNSERKGLTSFCKVIFGPIYMLTFVFYVYSVPNASVLVITCSSNISQW